MEGTQEIRTDLNDSSSHKDKKDKTRKRWWLIVIYVLAGLLLVTAGVYAFWLRPILKKPISQPLPIVLNPEKEKIEAFHTAEPTQQQILIEDIQFSSNLRKPPLFIEDQEDFVKPVCGKDRSWVILLVGIDSRSDSYAAGLADAIKLIRIDFVKKQINMVSLPRDLVVEMPEGRITIESPMKINQAYLGGTEGWGGYAGEGNGANSLAEAIEYNFGITTNHYMVVNFHLVIDVINAVGGVGVNLHQDVEGEGLGYFPSGYQHLDGQRALDLMRIRQNYTDDFRVMHQNIVLKAMFAKLKQPQMILRIPTLVNAFNEHVLTDLSPEQLISVGTCFFTHFDSSSIYEKRLPSDLIKAGRVFIPSLNGNSFVYSWDDKTVDFIHETLMGPPKETEE